MSSPWSDNNWLNKACLVSSSFIASTGLLNFLMRSDLTLSKSFALVSGSSVDIFWSIKAFLSADSSFASSALTFGLSCVAKIDSQS